MKLADNFKELLLQNQGRDFLKKELKDLFVFEEGDLEKYPDAELFLEHYFESYDLSRTFNKFKTQFGFFRKKNSPAEILVQKDIEERFPFRAIVKVWHMRRTISQWHYAEQDMKEILNRFEDLPEEEFLNELNKEED